MTNADRYRDKLLDLLCSVPAPYSFAVSKDWGISVCSDLDCSNCSFDIAGISCNSLRRAWLKREYIPRIAWWTVPADTKVLAKSKDENEWHRRYFAEYDGEGGVPLVYPAGVTSWSFYGEGKLDSFEEIRLADPEDIEKYRIKE